MSPAAPPSSVDAIIAAANELKLRRLAAKAAETSVPKDGRKGKKSDKEKKKKQVKTVRCSLQITPDEYRDLARLKKLLGKRGINTGKRQLIRAGLLLLAHLNPTDLKAAVRDVIAPEAPPE